MSVADHFTFINAAKKDIFFFIYEKPQNKSSSLKTTSRNIISFSIHVKLISFSSIFFFMSPEMEDVEHLQEICGFYSHKHTVHDFFFVRFFFGKMCVCVCDQRWEVFYLHMRTIDTISHFHIVFEEGKINSNLKNKKKNVEFVN